MTTMISCKCDHAYQDELYGYKQRVANVNTKAGKAICTVCGSVYNIGTQSSKK